MVCWWAIAWLALGLARCEQPQRELEGPRATAKEVADSRVKMTDENFEELLEKAEEGRRTELGRAAGLKKAPDEFLFATRQPRRPANTLRQRMGRLHYDMLYPDEAENPSRDTENRPKDREGGSRLTDDEPKSSDFHRMSHEGRAGGGEGPGGGKVSPTQPSPESCAEECPHSPWENVPPILICTIFVVAAILVLVLFLFMCIRYCLRGSHTCCHESQASSQNLEACLKRILKGEGDPCCDPPGAKKHKDKKKKKKKGGGGTC